MKTDERFVVTGASSGLGREIYQYLTCRYQTSQVIGVSHHGPDIVTDLSNQMGLLSVVAELVSCSPPHLSRPIRCLVNCAGVLHLGDGDDANADQIFNVNFWAPYHLSMNLRECFVSGESSVINVASVSGMIADPDTPVYGSSKAALISLTKSLAIKWAPHVRVNCISPGFFDTNLVPEPTPQHLIDRVPLGFEASTGMIISAVEMLLSCPYVTGSNVVVDGGLSCRAV
jgi:NAD(P)-dependent dehydrogenase (short-subunit alcohol dehydrogenase family)